MEKFSVFLNEEDLYWLSALVLGAFEGIVLGNYDIYTEDVRILES